ncbi:hypothetical protein FQR65_LT04464 [Abscondita terminalis]|nr:hypothetical protein FQR65_LT04464 [Abscondita terminalis]
MTKFELKLTTQAAIGMLTLITTYLKLIIKIEDFNIKQVEDLNIKQEHIDLPSTELHSESQIDYNQDDVYNHFGQYIASLLRTIGPPKAMRLQAKITALVVDEMCSPTNAIENN